MNEVKILKFLEAKNCLFVPKLVNFYTDKLQIVTTNCGARVERMDDARLKELFAELEQYGVRHEDAELRNVTYRQKDGRFCLIDFEFARILPGFEEPEPEK